MDKGLSAAIALVVAAIILVTCQLKEKTDGPIEESTTQETIAETQTQETTTMIFETTVPETKVALSDQELIAIICMAEAEDQSILCKRLVIDTILNRVDDSRFPNDIYSVVYQKGQFTCTTNGRLSRCYVRNDILELVQEELNERSCDSVLYFNEYDYPSWATPICHYDDLYFSR